MDGSPNILSWLALLAVPAFAFYAFRRHRAQEAALLVVLGGAMFLPCVVGFKLPVLPDLDKEVLPGLSALVACAVLKPRALGTRPFAGAEALLLVACVGAFGTVLTNGDPLVYGPTVLPGQTLYDGLVDSCGILVRWFPPFYLGRALFRTRDDLQLLLRGLALAGLLYSIPIFLELRLSPQLHNWLYGFHQSDFVQTIRFGGYRPKVFMRHGLNVALFMTVTILAAAALHRAKARLRPRLTPGRAAVFLTVVLVLCKSTGAYFYLALLLPLLLWAPVKWQLRAAMGAVTIILTYPFLRSMGWIPVDAIIDWMAENVDHERALSLWFRLFTEEQVLDNARERLLFGWGGYARPFEFDPVTGEMLTIVDGYWAIEIGTHGVWGFLSIFGLLLVPVVQAFRRALEIRSRRDQILVSALALIAVMYVFDWVPNSSISADLTFLVGAFSGLVPGILAQERAERRAARLAERARRASSIPPAPAPAPAPGLHAAPA